MAALLQINTSTAVIGKGGATSPSVATYPDGRVRRSGRAQQYPQERVDQKSVIRCDVRAPLGTPIAEKSTFYDGQFVQDLPVDGDLMKETWQQKPHVRRGRMTQTSDENQLAAGTRRAHQHLCVTVDKCVLFRLSSKRMVRATITASVSPWSVKFQQLG